MNTDKLPKQKTVKCAICGQKTVIKKNKYGAIHFAQLCNGSIEHYCAKCCDDYSEILHTDEW